MGGGDRSVSSSTKKTHVNIITCCLSLGQEKKSVRKVSLSQTSAGVMVNLAQGGSCLVRMSVAPSLLQLAERDPSILLVRGLHGFPLLCVQSKSVSMLSDESNGKHSLLRVAFS